MHQLLQLGIANAGRGADRGAADQNGLSLSYGYDVAGNRTSLTTASQSVAYTYDVLNRLSTVTPTLGGGGSYTYDAVGNRATLTHANGVVTSYGYNPRNQLTTLTTTRPGNVVEQKFTYTLDNSGLRLNVNETYGAGLTAAQAAYTYDPLKRLKTEYQTNSGGSRNVSWVYDGVGNRLSEARTGSVVKTTTYTYDANDRLTTEVVTGTGAGTTTYTYDTAGNLTQKDAPGGIEQYAYDDANRLREYTDTASQVTRYAYNHAGIRLSQTQNATGSTPSTTHYLVDPNTAYAQVIEEHGQVGSTAKTLSALYVLGDDRISQYRPAAGSTAASTRHYHADGLGSTRLLTNTSATVTDRYTYHAFGELDLPGSTVTSPNDFLYTGEQHDPNSGFYYLRARYMNPGNGRFTQQDAFAGFDSDTVTLHKYVYASAGPTNGRDPSGNVTLSEMSAVNNIRSELAQIQMNAGFGVYKSEVLGTDEDLNPIQAMYVTLLDAGAEVRQFLFRSHCNFCSLAVKGRFPLTFNKVRRGWGTPAKLFYSRTDPGFGSRIQHVLAHLMPKSGKIGKHTLFAVPRRDVLKLIDEAWMKRGAKPTLIGKNGNQSWIVDMGRVVGRGGETRIQIVIREKTIDEVITAYPVP